MRSDLVIVPIPSCPVLPSWRAEPPALNQPANGNSISRPRATQNHAQTSRILPKSQQRSCRAMFPENVAEHVGDLAQTGARLHRIDERRKNIVRAAGGGSQSVERRAPSSAIAGVAQPLYPLDLLGFERRILAVPLRPAGVGT